MESLCGMQLHSQAEPHRGQEKPQAPSEPFILMALLKVSRGQRSFWKQKCGGRPEEARSPLGRPDCSLEWSPPQSPCDFRWPTPPVHHPFPQLRQSGLEAHRVSCNLMCSWEGVAGIKEEGSPALTDSPPWDERGGLAYTPVSHESSPESLQPPSAPAGR